MFCILLDLLRALFSLSRFFRMASFWGFCAAVVSLLDSPDGHPFGGLGALCWMCVGLFALFMVPVIIQQQAGLHFVPS